MLFFFFLNKKYSTHKITDYCQEKNLCPQEREDVPMDMTNGEPGCQYYEQLCYNNLWLKVGDCVYIASHGLVRHRVGR